VLLLFGKVLVQEQVMLLLLSRLTLMVLLLRLKAAMVLLSLSGHREEQKEMATGVPVQITNS
jgi:hypothetical protein